MVFLDSLGCMASITLLAAIGFAMAKRGWIAQETERFLPTLVMKVVLPPYLAATVCTHFRREEFFHLVAGAAIPFASILLCFLLCRLAATLLGVDRRHRNLAAVMASFSNTILIGIPVNIALFGEEAMIYVLCYYLASTTLQWTMGVRVVCIEGQGHARAHGLREMVASLFSPPLVGMLAGVAVLVLDLPLPRFVLDTCSYLGRLATPLALIYIGILLAHVDWRKAHVGKDILFCLAGRVAACPLLLLGMLQFTDLPVPMQEVFLIQSSLPVFANITVVAAYYGADKEFASIFVSVSTILGMITVPVWMTILSILY